MSGRVIRADAHGQGESGIGGVAVSDGLSITRSDAEGRYTLRVDPQRRHTTLIQLTVPDGWRAPVGRGSVPSFFRRLDPAEGDVDHVDFTLEPDQTGGGGGCRILALADPHVHAGGVNDIDSFRRQVQLMNHFAATVADRPPRFIVVAGDLTNDATPVEFNDYLAAAGVSTLPVWSAPGNHDLAARVPGGPHPVPVPDVAYRDVIDAYRRAVGPEWYSFQSGGRHFVVLENYRGLREPDQLAWFERDLALHAAGRPVVIIAHVPWDVPQTPDRAQTAPYLDLIRAYDVRLLLAGHTHANAAGPVVGRATQVVTTSAAYAIDQTPRGFRVVDVEEPGATASFVEFDPERRPTIVFPVGPTPGTARTVRVNHYHPPGMPAEVEYRVPPGDWHPLTPLGRRTWAAPVDLTRLPGAADHRLLVRARAAGSRWHVRSRPLPVTHDAPDVPRQGRPWPMFHGDARHTGVAADVVSPPLTLAWVEHTGGTILTSSPAVADGAVFIGVRDEDGDRTNGVVAVDLASGSRRWWVDAPAPVEASVAVHGDTVLVPSVKGPLRALDVGTGAEHWHWAPPDHRCWMYFSPTVTEGVVYQAYIESCGAGVAALDAATGSVLWLTREPIGRNWISHGSPAVAGDRLVFATAYANLVCLDARSGAIQWQASFGGWTRSMPVLADDLVLLACQGDRVVAVDLHTGRLRWQYQAPNSSPGAHAPTAATPAVADGSAYAAFADGSVSSLRLADGTPQWRAAPAAAVISSPVVSGEHLYLGCNDGTLRALDLGTGVRHWYHDVGCWIASSPAVTGNTLVVGAWDGQVYAFTGARPAMAS